MFLTLIFFSLLSSLSAQNLFWTQTSPSQAVPKSGKVRDYLPESYQVFHLDLSTLENYLDKAPMEFTGGKPLTIQLPLPDGSLAELVSVESPVMKPEMAVKYPTIRTFAAKGLTPGVYSARFGYTELGFHAVIRTDKGMVYVDPLYPGQFDYYLVYFTSQTEASTPVPGCGWTAEEQPQEPKQGGGAAIVEKTTESVPVELRVYDLALACTGEFGQSYGGTVTSVLSAMNTALNRVNEIVMPEAGFKFELIQGNELLVFLNADTDPYFDANVGNSLLDQNTDVINSIITPSFYDIGHVFTMGCVDVGGVAGGTVCSNGKARGVTCFYSSNIESIAENVMAHELAHQFSASHSWANCPGNMGQLASNGAYEPGSGSTIMSYSGACGNQNVPSFGADYYHVISLQQMRNYYTTGLGATCPDLVLTGNNSPDVTLPYTNDFFIPISTPFELTSEASDPDGDDLTYCWEQFDLGPTTDLGAPEGDAPIFRSFPPNGNPNRVFPRIENVVGNISDNFEVLPTYSRNLTFRCTVRDNDPNGGGVEWREVKFKATDTAGPFTVMSPNSASVTWTGGELVEVTWDVANTDNAVVNCQSVNIKLSTDGGYNYPITLISGTPNTGSALVFVPDLNTNLARIRVEAADNIFFDISNANFTIEPATEPGWTYGLTTPVVQELCIPADASVGFVTGSLFGYDSLVYLDVVDGLPANVTAAFDASPINAGQTATLTFNFDEVLDNQNFAVTVRLISGTDTLFQLLSYDLVFSDFSQLALDFPLNGATNQEQLGLDFGWNGLPFADSYDFQIASSPTFAPNTIIDEGYNLINTDFEVDELLEKNTIYYWRVQTRNVCKESGFTDPFAFRTLTLQCDLYTSSDIPLGIPSIGAQTVTSNLPILDNGVIDDVNVIDLQGFHEGLGDVEFKLTSPAGTTVKLFGGICGNISPFFMDLDDDSPLGLTCPPVGGIAYKPQGALSAFDGENTSGNWVLTVSVLNSAGNGGLVNGWGLEFCANFTPNPPVVVTNDTLFTKPGGTRLIENNILLTEDPDNIADELEYTVVVEPAHGALFWFGNELSVGETFKQSSINAGNIWYVHDNDGSQTDYFQFLVQDGTGGFTGVQKFNIGLDPDAPIATEETSRPEPLRIFPNPNEGNFTIEIPQTAQGPFQLDIFQTDGRLLESRIIPEGTLTYNLETSLSSGLYVVRLRGGNGIWLERIKIAQ